MIDVIPIDMTVAVFASTGGFIMAGQIYNYLKKRVVKHWRKY
jgi:hypothetical protein